MDRLLIVDSTGVFADRLAAACRSLNIEPYLVIHHEYAERVAQRWRGRFSVADLAHPDRAQRAVVQFADAVMVAGIATVDEFLTELVQRAAAELGLPGGTGVPGAYRNKALMAELLSAARVDIPRTAVVETVDAARRLLVDGPIGYPVVVKPADNAGSTGVSVVTNELELELAVLEAISQHRSKPYEIPLDHRAVIQEYIAGVEYSVESVVHDGVIEHIAVTQKRTTSGRRRVEVGHYIDARSDAIVTRVGEAATGALTALGITAGVTHTEIMVAADKSCHVIEVAGRMGGDPIGELVEAATGVDLWRCLALVAIGAPTETIRVRNRYAMAAFVLPSVPGIVDRIDVTDRLDRIADVVKVRNRRGEAVADLRNNSDRFGYLIVTGDSEEAVTRAQRDALREIQIVYRDRSADPDRPIHD